MPSLCLYLVGRSRLEVTTRVHPPVASAPKRLIGRAMAWSGVAALSAAAGSDVGVGGAAGSWLACSAGVVGLLTDEELASVAGSWTGRQDQLVRASSVDLEAAVALELRV